MVVDRSRITLFKSSGLKLFQNAENIFKYKCTENFIAIALGVSES